MASRSTSLPTPSPHNHSENGILYSRKSGLVACGHWSEMDGTSKVALSQVKELARWYQDLSTGSFCAVIWDFSPMFPCLM